MTLLDRGTVLDNLRVADPHLERDRAWEVLRTVGLAALVSHLDGELDAEVRPRVHLGAAEAARLCLARALIARPDLLLIDAALDPVADDAALLDALMGPDTTWTVVVASREASVRARCSEALATGEED